MQLIFCVFLFVLLKSMLSGPETMASLVKSELLSASQDGGIGTHALLPSTNTRRITTSLKTTNNQKCKKIKLYVKLAVKEQTFIQTGRRIKDRQSGWR